ncbi:unnamed protein product, partial [Aureobasidium pullulans]
MGLKTYFRKPGKDAQSPTEKGEVIPPTPTTPACYTPRSRESAGLEGIPMQRLNDAKCDVMVNHVWSEQAKLLWNIGNDDEGVVIKKSRGQYVCCPPDLRRPDGFLEAVQALNVKVFNTRVINILLQESHFSFMPIGDDLRLQILPDMSCLSRCAKHQFAAFIADRRLLVVWDDQPENLIARAEKIERGLMAMIWSSDTADETNEKSNKDSRVSIQELDMPQSEECLAEKPRRVVLLHSITTGLTLCLILVVLGAGYRKIVKEIAYDNSYTRLALIAVAPVTTWLAFFFFQALISNILQIFGPISQVQENTKYYSGLPPKRLSSNGPLPHVTIQCPVYKEGLQTVIAPTVYSIKAAISTYEMQGGTANIFINDDGMQLLSAEEARARQDFFEEHSIGWVARPRHDPKGEHNPVPFLRRGKFKKASNMNYALWVSNRIEDKISAGGHRPDYWTQEDEVASYVRALEEVIEEDEGRTWADGNIRMGDYVLLIDSDTRVPTDCLLDAYSLGVMNVTESFFENGITFFTNLIYTQIKYGIASGNVAPFSAVQDIAYDCLDDSREKYWSESTVLEDFDIALRLQSLGYLVRFASYTRDGFKEGVSLTEKYAYGCSELIFHPFRYWLTRGPFTKLFRTFVMSGMLLPSKLTILSYIGTYYAIGSAWLFTLINYFIVYLSIIVVFTALGNVSLAILRYRIGEQSLVHALITNFKWAPLMIMFMGGLSLHVSQALLSHLFSVDMNWGATSKEVENTTFFKEVPKLIRNFRFTFLFCLVLSVGMVLLATVVPEFWRIDQFIAIYPLGTIVVSHFLQPIVLNPSLMLFTW